MDKKQIKEIVKIQLGYLQARIQDKNIEIAFSDAALDKLTEMGFDPQFGARPLKRVIQKEIENKLAIEILEGKISPNHEVKIDVKNREFIFY